MFIHQFKLNQLRTRFASSRLLAVCLVVVSTLFLANSVPLSVSANSDGSEPATFASSAAQNRQGEMWPGADIPPTGQISVIGDDIGLMLHNGNRANPGASAQRAIRGSLSSADEGLIYVTHDNQPRVQARASNTNAPHIVDNGVQMYEVSKAESGGWRTRAIGDDTYGSGELIAVSVEFSESVRVDGETTFLIRLDSGNRDLVPVSHRDETVIFAALVNPSDNDSNGVWIGDNTSTLDHNDADAIRSTGDSPRNANLTHARLGTQSNHKVKGSSTRPQLQSVRISSTPQYGDTYIRGEAIKIEARFDRAVVVNGDVDARIRSEAFGDTVTRSANYASGSGTSKLVFEYRVSFFDVDSDGIAIPGNSLAQNGDPAMGAQGGGSISGRSGGLLPDLSSRGKGENPNHKVDAGLAALPEVMTAIQWDWEQDTPGSPSVEMDFNIREDPGHFSEDQVLVIALGWGHLEGIRFAFGLRTDVDKPGTDGSQGKGVIFNRWDSQDAATSARVVGDGWTEAGNFGGPFTSVRRTYDWSEGNYSVRVAKDGGDDSDGRWFGLWITDKSTGVETHMGSLKFPSPEEGEPEIWTRNDVFGSVMAILGNTPVRPSDIPVFEVALGLPDASGGDFPNAVTVNYSLLNGVLTNENVGYDAATGKVIMRVGGSTSRTTRPGTTITGLQVPQLTASIGDVPESHNGRTAFTFELTFSEEPGARFSYKTLRDHAFTVTGGSVIGARRLDRPSNIRWEIKVNPNSSDAVVVVLPVPDYCGAQGAICTADGRELSAAANLTVPGPGDGN